LIRRFALRKTSLVATVSGVFKFKNAGDAVLKVEPPKPSCGCTVAELKPDTLQPGETGELPFTLHRGQAKAQLDKRIAVKSNDPQTPEVLLSPEALYWSLPDRDEYAGRAPGCAGPAAGDDSLGRRQAD